MNFPAYSVPASCHLPTTTINHSTLTINLRPCFLPAFHEHQTTKTENRTLTSNPRLHVICSRGVFAPFKPALAARADVAGATEGIRKMYQRKGLSTSFTSLLSSHSAAEPVSNGCPICHLSGIFLSGCCGIQVVLRWGDVIDYAFRLVVDSDRAMQQVNDGFQRKDIQAKDFADVIVAE